MNFMDRNIISNLEGQERKRKWWADKKEWSRQKYKGESKDIPDDDKLNRMAARMWKIMGEEKKNGVLDGSYNYTGKGLSLNPESESMGKYEHLEMTCEI